MMAFIMIQYKRLATNVSVFKRNDTSIALHYENNSNFSPEFPNHNANILLNETSILPSLHHRVFSGTNSAIFVNPTRHTHFLLDVF